MALSLREYRARIRSVESTKKITRAMELIAASRIIKAQQRATAAAPYARELTRAVSAVATYSNEKHPLTTETTDSNRAAVLIITSDRGLAGAYSSSVIKEAERLIEKLKGEGKDVEIYVSGRKGVAYFKFRRRDVAESWAGHSDQPTYDVAREIGEKLIERFVEENTGVDEVHVVYTRFRSMLVQEPVDIRLLPLEVVESDEKPTDDEVLPLYEFEPSAAQVLDALLPKYVQSRIFYALLQAAASELAARQRAMKSATDNASELIKKYTRIANQARQAGHHPGNQRDRRWRQRPRRRDRRQRIATTSRVSEKNMTATAEETKAGSLGRIARVIGPVVDIEFPVDSMPEMYNALTVDVTLAGETTTIILEVAQHIGDGMVRAISMKPTDGMVRGAQVTDTGESISVPVGDITKGHVFNATGDVPQPHRG